MNYDEAISRHAYRSLQDAPDGPVRQGLMASINLLDNYTRGRVAEVLVSELCGAALVGDGYGSWDVQRGSTRIEVKASGDVQSWPQQKASAPSFSIRRASGWIEQTDGSFLEDPRKLRRSDVYVFAHHRGTCPDRPEEWTFYLVPTRSIDDLCDDQKTITLSSVRQRLSPVIATAESLDAEIEQLLA